VVHCTTFSFNYFFFVVVFVLFIHFVLDKMKKGVLYQVKQPNHVLSN
jgi:hypothetical protein